MVNDSNGSIYCLSYVETSQRSSREETPVPQKDFGLVRLKRVDNRFEGKVKSNKGGLTSFCF